jgi:predicted lipoprotein with Yx(FWY)xxD motif
MVHVTARYLVGPAVLLLSAALVSGCGSSSSASPAPPTTAGGRPATVGIGSTGLGNILVDQKGRTLYLFEADSAGRSACTGACTKNWPPLRKSGTPTAGSGAQASKLAADSMTQVTYNGHPLYRFSGDQQPGDTNGQGLTAFGGAWYVVSSAGDAITSTASTSSGGGGGY